VNRVGHERLLSIAVRQEAGLHVDHHDVFALNELTESLRRIRQIDGWGDVVGADDQSAMFSLNCLTMLGPSADEPMRVSDLP
jgi:hypothetical protein